jgi:hypothetical protein
MSIINNQMASLFTQDHSNAPYTNWSFQITYEWAEGLAQLPVAEAPVAGVPGGVSCEIVRESAPFGTMVVEWAAWRNGLVPDVPSPETDNPNLRLNFARIKPSSPPLDNAGKLHVYRISGEYRYLLLRPIWAPGSGLWMGWTVYDKTPPGVHILSASQFKRVF